MLTEQLIIFKVFKLNMKFLLATIFFGAQAKIALSTSNEYQELTKEDSLIVAEDQKIQDISVVEKATVHEKQMISISSLQKL